VEPVANASVVSEPQPQPAPKPVLKEPTSNKPKDTPSIFNRKKPKEEQGEEKPSVLDKKSKEFNDEDLQRVWKSFGDSRKEAGDTDKLILNREVEKGDEHQVIIHLASQLEVSFLEKLEVDLIQHLRTELENDHITLKREIMQEEESKKLYTSKDIFDHMVKENPNLKDLKDRLGLDFDY